MKNRRKLWGDVVVVRRGGVVCVGGFWGFFMDLLRTEHIFSYDYMSLDIWLKTILELEKKNATATSLATLSD